jgi:hypothetical protein
VSASSHCESLGNYLLTCIHILANWKGRAEVIDYCVRVTEAAVDDASKALNGREADLDADRSIQARRYAEEVKVGRASLYRFACA